MSTTARRPHYLFITDGAQYAFLVYDEPTSFDLSMVTNNALSIIRLADLHEIGTDLRWYPIRDSVLNPPHPEAQEEGPSHWICYDDPDQPVQEYPFDQGRVDRQTIFVVSAKDTISTISIPLDEAKLVRRIFLPQNPRKMRNATPEAKQAAVSFAERVETENSGMDGWPNAIRISPTLPNPSDILADPSASAWLKTSLRAALDRDPVAAANDAEVLAAILDQAARKRHSA